MIITIARECGCFGDEVGMQLAEKLQIPFYDKEKIKEVLMPTLCKYEEDGEIVFIFDTKHAIGFLTDSGISLLIHVGIDTVKLNGEGFEVLVENGEKVKKGTPLLRLDLEYLKQNAPSLISPVICTELGDNQKIHLLKEGDIQAGEPLFAVDFYE